MTPIIGSRRAWDSALPAATPTRSPVNMPGPEVDRDGADVGQLDAGLPAQELDGRGEGLGVAAAAGGVDGAEHALVPADGAADLGGGRGDPEDQHQVSCHGAEHAGEGVGAGAQAAPTARKAT